MGAVALVLLLRHDGVGSTVAAQAGVVVAAAPLAVAAVYLALSEVIGDRLTASTPHIGSTPSTLDGATTSWFGPLGFCALVGGIVALRIATRSDRPVLAVLALAPVALIVIFAILLTWDQSRGRFMIFGFALAAVAWSAALRHRGLAWGSAGIAAVTMVLALWSSESKPVRLGPLPAPPRRRSGGSRTGTRSPFCAGRRKNPLSCASRRSPSHGRRLFPWRSA
jgi:hypothetical protein